MLQVFSGCSVPDSTLRPNVFWSAIGLAGLLLLAIPAPSQSRSNECGGSRDAECRWTAGAQSFLETATTDPALGAEEGQISSVSGDTLPITQSIAVNPGNRLLTSAERCCATTGCTHWFSSSERPPYSVALSPDAANSSDKAAGNAVVLIRNPPPRLNDRVFYRNRLDFSLDGGWLPINIPFVFDVFLGDGYTMTDLRYTLVPIIASLRWQMNDVGGPWIFRGNWELETSGAVTLIPRGPETRYFAWIMGVRRNFVPHRGRVAPYFDGRLGLGSIDAKEPLGILYAQGQDFTFTVNMGSGVRYNFNTRYSISAGLNWMHISNLYLSEPKFANYGINVYGPMFGFNVRMGKLRQRGSE